MKFRLFLSLLLVCFMSMNASAQDNVYPQNIIKINPLVIGHYQVTYERLLNRKNSISLSGLYSKTTEYLYKLNNDDERSETIEANAWKFYLEHRYYLKDAPSSLFLGTFGRYVTSDESVVASANQQSFNHSRTSNILGLGLLIGKQYVFLKNFTFDWYVGGMGEYAKRSSVKFTNASMSLKKYEEEFLKGTKLNRWRPNIRLGLSVGYRF